MPTFLYKKRIKNQMEFMYKRCSQIEILSFIKCDKLIVLYISTKYLNTCFQPLTVICKQKKKTTNIKSV